MKEPTRLLDAGATEAELHVLRAGASEEPPALAMQRLAAKLGVPAAASLPPAAVAGTAKLSWSVIGLVAAGLTLGAGGVVWLTVREAPAPGAMVAPPPRAAAAARPALPPEPHASATSNPRALAEEIARLDGVRRQLAAKRAKPALAALDDYARDYPEGALRQEAALLRIEASSRAGQKQAARALAEKFLANNPDSPHAPRIRALAFDHAR